MAVDTCTRQGYIRLFSSTFKIIVLSHLIIHFNQLFHNVFKVIPYNKKKSYTSKNNFIGYFISINFRMVLNFLNPDVFYLLHRTFSMSAFLHKKL